MILGSVVLYGGQYVPGMSVSICHLIAPMARCFATVVSFLVCPVVPVLGLSVEERKTCFFPLSLGW